ncbi:MAG: hypothetical protein Q8R76_05970 [Candidatus Omnitrophota bacterium]|nr:hypothetical protein [Candidatus Omnitrophota bacterium]
MLPETANKFIASLIIVTMTLTQAVPYGFASDLTLSKTGEYIQETDATAPGTQVESEDLPREYEEFFDDSFSPLSASESEENVETVEVTEEVKEELEKQDLDKIEPVVLELPSGPIDWDLAEDHKLLKEARERYGDRVVSGTGHYPDRNALDYPTTYKFYDKDGNLIATYVGGGLGGADVWTEEPKPLDEALKEYYEKLSAFDDFASGIALKGITLDEIKKLRNIQDRLKEVLEAIIALGEAPGENLLKGFQDRVVMLDDILSSRPLLIKMGDKTLEVNISEAMRAIHEQYRRLGLVTTDDFYRLPGIDAADLAGHETFAQYLDSRQVGITTVISVFKGLSSYGNLTLIHGLFVKYIEQYGNIMMGDDRDADGYPEVNYTVFARLVNGTEIARREALATVHRMIAERGIKVPSGGTESFEELLELVKSIDKLDEDLKKVLGDYIDSLDLEEVFKRDVQNEINNVIRNTYDNFIRNFRDMFKDHNTPPGGLLREHDIRFPSGNTLSLDDIVDFISKSENLHQVMLAANADFKEGLGDSNTGLTNTIRRLLDSKISTIMHDLMSHVTNTINARQTFIDDIVTDHEWSHPLHIEGALTFEDFSNYTVELLSLQQSMKDRLAASEERVNAASSQFLNTVRNALTYKISGFMTRTKNEIKMTIRTRDTELNTIIAEHNINFSSAQPVTFEWLLNRVNGVDDLGRELSEKLQAFKGKMGEITNDDGLVNLILTEMRYQVDGATIWENNSRIVFPGLYKTIREGLERVITNVNVEFDIEGLGKVVITAGDLNALTNGLPSDIASLMRFPGIMEKLTEEQLHELEKRDREVLRRNCCFDGRNAQADAGNLSIFGRRIQLTGLFLQAAGAEVVNADGYVDRDAYRRALLMNDRLEALYNAAQLVIEGSVMRVDELVRDISKGISLETYERLYQLIKDTNGAVTDIIKLALDGVIHSARSMVLDMLQDDFNVLLRKIDGILAEAPIQIRIGDKVYVVDSRKVRDAMHQLLNMLTVRNDNNYSKEQYARLTGVTQELLQTLQTDYELNASRQIRIDWREPTYSRDMNQTISLNEFLYRMIPVILKSFGEVILGEDGEVSYVNIEDQLLEGANAPVEKGQDLQTVFGDLVAKRFKDAKEKLHSFDFSKWEDRIAAEKLIYGLVYGLEKEIAYLLQVLNASEIGVLNAELNKYNYYSWNRRGERFNDTVFGRPSFYALWEYFVYRMLVAPRTALLPDGRVLKIDVQSIRSIPGFPYQRSFDEELFPGIVDGDFDGAEKLQYLHSGPFQLMKDADRSLEDFLQAQTERDKFIINLVLRHYAHLDEIPEIYKGRLFVANEDGTVSLNTEIFRRLIKGIDLLHQQILKQVKEWTAEALESLQALKKVPMTVASIKELYAAVMAHRTKIMEYLNGLTRKHEKEDVMEMEEDVTAIYKAMVDEMIHYMRDNDLVTQAGGREVVIPYGQLTQLLMKALEEKFPGEDISAHHFASFYGISIEDLRPANKLEEFLGMQIIALPRNSQYVEIISKLSEIGVMEVLEKAMAAYGEMALRSDGTLDPEKLVELLLDGNLAVKRANERADEIARKVREGLAAIEKPLTNQSFAEMATLIDNMKIEFINVMNDMVSGFEREMFDAVQSHVSSLYQETIKLRIDMLTQNPIQITGHDGSQFTLDLRGIESEVVGRIMALLLQLPEEKKIFDLISSPIYRSETEPRVFTSKVSFANTTMMVEPAMALEEKAVIDTGYLIRLPIYRPWQPWYPLPGNVDPKDTLTQFGFYQLLVRLAEKFGSFATDENGDFSLGNFLAELEKTDLDRFNRRIKMLEDEVTAELASRVPEDANDPVSLGAVIGMQDYLDKSRERFLKALGTMLNDDQNKSNAISSANAAWTRVMNKYEALILERKVTMQIHGRTVTFDGKVLHEILVEEYNQHPDFIDSYKEGGETNSAYSNYRTLYRDYDNKRYYDNDSNSFRDDAEDLEKKNLRYPFDLGELKRIPAISHKDLVGLDVNSKNQVKLSFLADAKELLKGRLNMRVFAPGAAIQTVGVATSSMKSSSVMAMAEMSVRYEDVSYDKVLLGNYIEIDERRVKYVPRRYLDVSKRDAIFRMLPAMIMDHWRSLVVNGVVDADKFRELLRDPEGMKQREKQLVLDSLKSQIEAFRKALVSGDPDMPAIGLTGIVERDGNGYSLVVYEPRLYKYLLEHTDADTGRLKADAVTDELLALTSLTKDQLIERPINEWRVKLPHVSYRLPQDKIYPIYYEEDVMLSSLKAESDSSILRFPSPRWYDLVGKTINIMKANVSFQVNDKGVVEGVIHEAVGVTPLKHAEQAKELLLNSSQARLAKQLRDAYIEQFVTGDNPDLPKGLKAAIAAYLKVGIEDIVSIAAEARDFIRCLGGNCPTWSKTLSVWAVVDGVKKHFAGVATGGWWGFILEPIREPVYRTLDDAVDEMIADERRVDFMPERAPSVFLIETDPLIDGRALEAIADAAKVAVEQITAVDFKRHENRIVCKGPGCDVWSGDLRVTVKQGDNPEKHFEGEIVKIFEPSKLNGYRQYRVTLEEYVPVHEHLSRIDLSAWWGDIHYIDNKQAVIYGQYGRNDENKNGHFAAIVDPRTGEILRYLKDRAGWLTGAVSENKRYAAFFENDNFNINVLIYDLHTGTSTSYRIENYYTWGAGTKKDGYLDFLVSDSGKIHVLHRGQMPDRNTYGPHEVRVYGSDGKIESRVAFEGDANDAYLKLVMRGNWIYAIGNRKANASSSHPGDLILIQRIKVKGNDLEMGEASRVNAGIEAWELDIAEGSRWITVYDFNKPRFTFVYFGKDPSEDKLADIPPVNTAGGSQQARNYSAYDPKGILLVFTRFYYMNEKERDRLSVYDTKTGTSKSYDFRTIMQYLGIGGPDDGFVKNFGFSLNLKTRRFVFSAGVSAPDFYRHRAGENYLYEGSLDDLYALLEIFDEGRRYLELPDGSKQWFNEDGRLIKKIDKDGNVFEVDWKTRTATMTSVYDGSVTTWKNVIADKGYEDDGRYSIGVWYFKNKKDYPDHYFKFGGEFVSRVTTAKNAAYFFDGRSWNGDLGNVIKIQDADGTLELNWNEKTATRTDNDGNVTKFTDISVMQTQGSECASGSGDQLTFCPTWIADYMIQPGYQGIGSYSTRVEKDGITKTGTFQLIGRKMDSAYPKTIVVNGKTVIVDMEALVEALKAAKNKARFDSGVLCFEGCGDAQDLFLLQGVKDVFAIEELNRFEHNPRPRFLIVGPTYSRQGWIDFATELLRRYDEKGLDIFNAINRLMITDVWPPRPFHSQVNNDKVMDIVLRGIEQADPRVARMRKVILSDLAKSYGLKKVEQWYAEGLVRIKVDMKSMTAHVAFDKTLQEQRISGPLVDPLGEFIVPAAMEFNFKEVPDSRINWFTVADPVPAVLELGGIALDVKKVTGTALMAEKSLTIQPAMRLMLTGAAIVYQKSALQLNSFRQEFKVGRIEVSYDTNTWNNNLPSLVNMYDESGNRVKVINMNGFQGSYECAFGEECAFAQVDIWPPSASTPRPLIYYPGNDDITHRFVQFRHGDFDKGIESTLEYQGKDSVTLAVINTFQYRDDGSLETITRTGPDGELSKIELDTTTGDVAARPAPGSRVALITRADGRQRNIFFKNWEELIDRTRQFESEMEDPRAAQVRKLVIAGLDSYGMTREEIEQWLEAGLLKIEVDLKKNQARAVFSEKLQGRRFENAKVHPLGAFIVPAAIQFTFKEEEPFFLSIAPVVSRDGEKEAVDVEYPLDPGLIKPLLPFRKQLILASADIQYEAGGVYGRMSVDYSDTGRLASVKIYSAGELVKEVKYQWFEPCNRWGMCLESIWNDSATVYYPQSTDITRRRVDWNSGGLMTLMIPSGAITGVQEFGLDESGKEVRLFTNEYKYGGNNVLYEEDVDYEPIGSVEDYELTKVVTPYLSKIVRRDAKNNVISTIDMRPFLEKPEFDMNQDGVVDQADAQFMRLALEMAEGKATGDLNFDGVVDAKDLRLFYIGRYAVIRLADGWQKGVFYKDYEDLLDQARKFEASNDEALKSRLAKYVTGNMATEMGLTDEALAELIESIEVDLKNLTVSVRFKDGKMGRDRLIAPMNNGDLPETVVYQLFQNGQSWGFKEAVWEWPVTYRRTYWWTYEDRNVAKVLYENDTVSKIEWRIRSKVTSAGMPCFGEECPAPVVKTYDNLYQVDSYTHHDAQIEITQEYTGTKHPDAEVVAIEFIGSERFKPAYRKDVLTLRKLRDGQYHIERVTEYDTEGQVIATTTFEYATLGAASTLSRVIRWDAAERLHTSSAVITGGNTARITVGGQHFYVTVTFDSYETLLNHMKALEVHPNAVLTEAVKKAALVQLSDKMALSMAHLEAMIEEIEVTQGYEVIVRFKEGNMGDDRKFRMLEDASLPAAARVSFGQEIRIGDDGEVLGLAAHTVRMEWDLLNGHNLRGSMSIDPQGRITHIGWNQTAPVTDWCKGPICPAYMPGPVTVAYFIETYLYGDDGIKIVRRDFEVGPNGEISKRIAAEDTYDTIILGDVTSVIELKRMGDKRFHVSSVTDYDGKGNLVAVTRFSYLTATTLIACIPGEECNTVSTVSVGLAFLRRKNAAGELLSEIRFNFTAGSKVATIKRADGEELRVDYDSFRGLLDAAAVFENQVNEQIALAKELAEALKRAMSDNGNWDVNQDGVVDYNDVSYVWTGYETVLRVLDQLPEPILTALDFDQDGKVTKKDHAEVRRRILESIWREHDIREAKVLLERMLQFDFGMMRQTVLDLMAEGKIKFEVDVKNMRASIWIDPGVRRDGILIDGANLTNLLGSRALPQTINVKLGRDTELVALIAICGVDVSGEKICGAPDRAPAKLHLRSAEFEAADNRFGRNKNLFIKLDYRKTYREKADDRFVLFLDGDNLLKGVEIYEGNPNIVCITTPCPTGKLIQGISYAYENNIAVSATIDYLHAGVNQPTHREVTFKALGQSQGGSDHWARRGNYIDTVADYIDGQLIVKSKFDYLQTAVLCPASVAPDGGGVGLPLGPCTGGDVALASITRTGENGEFLSAIAGIKSAEGFGFDWAATVEIHEGRSAQLGFNVYEELFDKVRQFETINEREIARLVEILKEGILKNTFSMHEQDIEKAIKDGLITFVVDPKTNTAKIHLDPKVRTKQWAAALFDPLKAMRHDWDGELPAVVEVKFGNGPLILAGCAWGFICDIPQPKHIVEATFIVGAKDENGLFVEHLPTGYLVKYMPEVEDGEIRIIGVSGDNRPHSVEVYQATPYRECAQFNPFGCGALLQTIAYTYGEDGRTATALIETLMEDGTVSRRDEVTLTRLGDGLWYVDTVNNSKFVYLISMVVYDCIEGVECIPPPPMVHLAFIQGKDRHGNDLYSINDIKTSDTAGYRYEATVYTQGERIKTVVKYNNYQELFDAALALTHVVSVHALDFTEPLEVRLLDDGSYESIYKGATYQSDADGKVEIPGTLEDLMFHFNDDGTLESMTFTNGNNTMTVTFEEDGAGNLRVKTETAEGGFGWTKTFDYAEKSVTWEFSFGIQKELFYDLPQANLRNNGSGLSYEGNVFVELMSGMAPSVGRPYFWHKTLDGKYYRFIQIGDAFDLNDVDWLQVQERNTDALRALLRDDIMLLGHDQLETAEEDDLVFTADLRLGVNGFPVKVKFPDGTEKTMQAEVSADRKIVLTVAMPDGTKRTYVSEITAEGKILPLRLKPSFEVVHEMEFGAGRVILEEGTDSAGNAQLEALVQARDGDGWKTLKKFRIKKDTVKRGHSQVTRQPCSDSKPCDTGGHPTLSMETLDGEQLLFIDNSVSGPGYTIAHDGTPDQPVSVTESYALRRSLREGGEGEWQIIPTYKYRTWALVQTEVTTYDDYGQRSSVATERRGPHGTVIVVTEEFYPIPPWSDMAQRPTTYFLEIYGTAGVILGKTEIGQEFRSEADAGLLTEVLGIDPEGQAVRVEIKDDEVILFITNSKGQPVLINRTGFGVFTMNYGTDMAEVRIKHEDGTIEIRRYKCVPGWNPGREPIWVPIEIEPIELPDLPTPDPRKPVPGFEEWVLGLHVETEFIYPDGTSEIVTVVQPKVEPVVVEGADFEAAALTTMKGFDGIDTSGLNTRGEGHGPGFITMRKGHEQGAYGFNYFVGTSKGAQVKAQAMTSGEPMTLGSQTVIAMKGNRRDRGAINARVRLYDASGNEVVFLFKLREIMQNFIMNLNQSNFDASRVIGMSIEIDQETTNLTKGSVDFYLGQVDTEVPLEVGKSTASDSVNRLIAQHQARVLAGSKYMTLFEPEEREGVKGYAARYDIRHGRNDEAALVVAAEEDEPIMFGGDTLDFWMQAAETEKDTVAFENLKLELTIMADDGQMVTTEIYVTKQAQLYQIDLSKLDPNFKAKKIKDIVIKASRKAENAVQRAQFSFWLKALADKLHVPTA